MKKIAKLFSVVAVAAAACTFFSLNSSNEIICGNIEALTSGDNGNGSSTMPSIQQKGSYVTEVDVAGGYYEVADTHGDCAWYPNVTDVLGTCVRSVYTKQNYLDWWASQL